MSISKRLGWYLDQQGVEYRLLSHPHSHCSKETADLAHIPEEQLAKSVLLEDERGYIIAVIPASNRLALKELAEQLDRELELASEMELGQVFSGCEIGAVPPVGEAFGIPTVFDDSLLNASEVYLESGDHRELVHINASEFGRLFATAKHGRFSHRDPTPH